MFFVFLNVKCLVIAQSVIPGHAHNDYENDGPLSDALSLGFMAIEVDIHLIEDEIYVSHDRPQILEASKTLDALYLKPLEYHIEMNDGVVYQNYDGHVLLMIDIKTDAVLSYRKLVEKLAYYPTIMAKSSQVKFLVSGNRPVDLIAKNGTGLIGLDGRLSDGEVVTSDIAPIVSDNYINHFGWDGNDTMPEKELMKLKQLVNRVHAKGQKLRLWAAPDKPNCWEVLLVNGVDIINTDRLAEFSDFMKKYSKD